MDTITKLAGLNLKTNSSGTHIGQARITKRGHKRLRALVFRVMMPLVAKMQPSRFCMSITPNDS
ncbi:MULTISPECIES: transposase [Paenibacillus]|uniref:transposase n=1 Tax=Paenibacillus TaxID=44249 RepID=UPI0037CAAB31